MMDVYSNALIKPEHSLMIRVINLSCLLIDNKQKDTFAHGTSAHLHTCLLVRDLDDSQK